MSTNLVMSPLIEELCRIAIRDLHNGGKIACIRFVRNIAFTDLKFSKDFVEHVMNENNLQFSNDVIKNKLRDILKEEVF